VEQFSTLRSVKHTRQVETFVLQAKRQAIGKVRVRMSEMYPVFSGNFAVTVRILIPETSRRRAGLRRCRSHFRIIAEQADDLITVERAYGMSLFIARNAADRISASRVEIPRIRNIDDHVFVGGHIQGRIELQVA